MRSESLRFWYQYDVFVFARVRRLIVKVGPPRIKILLLVLGIDVNENGGPWKRIPSRAMILDVLFSQLNPDVLWPFLEVFTVACATFDLNENDAANRMRYELGFIARCGLVDYFFSQQ